jgi:hypothetical protein
MADIFGLDKGDNQKRLLSSHDQGATVVKIGGASPRLVQDASLQYQQRTEARFEIGYEKLYWVCGQSQGSLTLNKLVGENSVAGGGVWEGLKDGMEASKQGGNAAADITLSTKNGGVQGNAVCQSATISANVGNMAVQDNSTWSIGDLTKT